MPTPVDGLGSDSTQIAAVKELSSTVSNEIRLHHAAFRTNVLVRVDQAPGIAFVLPSR